MKIFRVVFKSGSSEYDELVVAESSLGAAKYAIKNSLAVGEVDIVVSWGLVEKQQRWRYSQYHNDFTCQDGFVF